MSGYKYLFGPVPSRRLGASLGVSPIPERTCNYSCVYCQLGRTLRMTNTRQEFFPLEEILAEFREYLQGSIPFDVVTVVGEGEPTLYSRLGELIAGLKKETDKPVAVITNGALLYDAEMRRELMEADIVLPSLDAVTEEQYRKIDRPMGSIGFTEMAEGLRQFAREYQGQLWIEIMLVDGMNDSPEDIAAFKEFLGTIDYDRVYLNTPVRPPAEGFVHTSAPERIDLAARELGGISIDQLTSGSFFSEVEDPYEAILSIARRHPMNQFEVESFLEAREIPADQRQALMERLGQDPGITVVPYKGIITYRVN